MVAAGLIDRNLGDLAVGKALTAGFCVLAVLKG
jgi:hypothetical protein